MKVAFVVGGFPSLSETFILNQIIDLLDYGVDVEIVAQFNPGEEKVHPDVETHGLAGRVHYFPVIPRNRLIRVFKGFWLLIRNFHRNPGRILRCLSIRRFGRDALSLKILYYNLPLLKKKFDVLHCHFGQNGIIGGFLKKAGAGVNLVTTFHGYDLSEFLRRNGDQVYRDLFQTADLCLPISRVWRKKLLALGCPAEKIRVHRMGIRLDRFPFKEREKPRRGRINILTVGRLVEKKGHRYALQAMVQVFNYHSGVDYHVIGDGPLMDDMKRLAEKLDVLDRIRFYGACSRDEIIKFYARSHLFLLPSMTSADGDQEGIPVVLMEAQASGLPVVTTRHSGIPEGVREGASALLVEEKNSDALAGKIIYLLDHAEDWKTMGRNGRQLIEKEFNQQKLSLDLLRLFEELCGIAGS